MVEPIAAPIWTIGPSRPAVPPKPMVIDEAMTFTPTTRVRILPPRVAKAVITSGTPCPFASLAKRWINGPTNNPPMAGSSTMPAAPKMLSADSMSPLAKAASSRKT